MERITFLLNGETVSIADQPATATLLDWLRDTRGLTGTKEGCNEGDCGACTVWVADSNGPRALNACILFLPQLNGKSVRTVEGLEGTHPVQDQMVAHHGSQCGFCTPGFIMSMAVAHAEGRSDHDTVLAGNLCRCTGYAPIIRAAVATESAPVPDWITSDLEAIAVPSFSDGMSLVGAATDTLAPSEATFSTSDAFADWYVANPDATIIAGATDVGLWVTKGLQEISKPTFVSGIKDLNFVDLGADTIRVGATVTVETLMNALIDVFPSYAEMLRRYGSTQVRQAATLGGNIANGSPIGDNPPPLIALGATLHLRRGTTRRSLLLEDFFLEYGKQDLQPGEFVEAVSIPRGQGDLYVYKVSKRFDQDISALCGAFYFEIEDNLVQTVRIAFGGMAGIPKRSTAVEACLTGQPMTSASIDAALPAFAEDFAPLSDMRAGADYRLQVARNLLRRAFAEYRGQASSVLQVSA